jgi:RPA family protein
MIERQTAYLTTIGALLNGSFIKSEAHMQPNYVRTAEGKELSRTHIIAVIVSFDEGTHAEAVLDDGTGKITARSFDNPTYFSSFNLGDIIRIIGRVRAFNEQIYLIPEIVKKITNRQFIALHKLQLQQNHDEIIENIPVSEISDETTSEISIDTIEETPPSPVDQIIALIKTKDTGDGALIEEIAQTVENGERLIHNLLEAGDIFELRPGRVKVLE